MELRVNLKPHQSTGATKQAAFDNSPIGRRGLIFTVSTDFGIGYTQLTRNDYVYVYTSQKYRAKRGIRKAFWEINTYTIPVAVLKEMRMKVKQGPRTFTFC